MIYLQISIYERQIEVKLPKARVTLLLECTKLKLKLLQIETQLGHFWVNCVFSQTFTEGLMALLN